MAGRIQRTQQHGEVYQVPAAPLLLFLRWLKRPGTGKAYGSFLWAILEHFMGTCHQVISWRTHTETSLLCAGVSDREGSFHPG